MSARWTVCYGFGDTHRTHVDETDPGTRGLASLGASQLSGGETNLIDRNHEEVVRGTSLEAEDGFLAAPRQQTHSDP